MARIAGVDIPDNKKVWVSLTYIYGIGIHTAKGIVVKANIDDSKRVKDLNEEEMSRIRQVIEAGGSIEGERRQEVFRNIKRLKEIKSYKGIRHKLGLPVRGQRTRTNARTRKGRAMAVGGLNKKIDKK